MNPVTPFPTEPTRTYTNIGLPAPMTAFVVCARYLAPPRSITDVFTEEYRAVGSRVDETGWGEFLVQETDNLIVPLSTIDPLVNGDGVLVAVLPADQQPEWGKAIPRAIEVLAARFNANQQRLAPGGAA